MNQMFYLLRASLIVIISCFDGTHGFSNVLSTTDVPRTKIFQTIEKGLNKHHIIVLEGFGGMGKSNTLKQYIQSHNTPSITQYKHIFWIDARKSIFDQLKTYASSLLDFPSNTQFLDSENEAILLEKIKTLAHSRKIKLLIIIDSLDSHEMAQKILPYLPQQHMDCIITTRLSFHCPYSLKILPFSHEESYEYLHTNLPTLSKTEINDLITLLKCYPLASYARKLGLK